MDQVKFFKCCLPQILLGPFLNTLSHMHGGFLPWHSTLNVNVLKNISSNLHPTIKFTVELATFDNVRQINQKILKTFYLWCQYIIQTLICETTKTKVKST